MAKVIGLGRSLPTDVVNLTNLQSGIRVFLDKKAWDRDFHNSRYQRYHTLQRKGQLTCYVLVDELAEWKAIIYRDEPDRDKDWYCNRL